MKNKKIKSRFSWNLIHINMASYLICYGLGSLRDMQRSSKSFPPPPFIQLNLPSHIGVHRASAIREKDLKPLVQDICLLAVFNTRIEQLPKTKKRLSQKNHVFKSFCTILRNMTIWKTDNEYYYMEESVLLGTKPLVDSIRHFIRDPSGVFSVCHLCECRIVQWRHDSRLFL